MSIYSGKIEEIPGVAIDDFTEDNARSRAFFLSHCHSDHTKGLYSCQLLEHLNETKAFIYMSEMSAAIVAHETNNGNVMKNVKILPQGTSIISLPEDKVQSLPETVINVSVLPAGHCIGSVMYLLRTESKTILYTGDFRISENDLPKYGHFTKNGIPIHIDAMYVDTTFLSKNYNYFPKRSESIRNVLDLIRNFLNKSPENRIAINISAKYGYEFVFNEIYKKLGIKVNVNSDRWRFYSSVRHLVNGVTSDESKIHLCLKKNLKSHENCIKNYSEKQKFLTIHLSAMKWSNVLHDDNTFNVISKKIDKDLKVDVCFSTHCSSSELRNFVDYFNPSKIIGFPNKYIVDSHLENVDSCKRSLQMTTDGAVKKVRL